MKAFSVHGITVLHRSWIAVVTLPALDLANMLADSVDTNILRTKVENITEGGAFWTEDVFNGDEVGAILAVGTGRAAVWRDH